MSPLHPGQGAREFRHAGVEVRGGVRRRSEDLITADVERWQRVRELRRRNPWNVERRAGGCGQLRGRSMHGAARVPRTQFVQQVARERVLIVGRQCPRGRVLRSERACRGATAFRQGCHWLEPTPEVGQPRVSAIAVRSEHMIEPSIPLVLVVELARRSTIVVRRPGGCRFREPQQQRTRDRIHALDRNRVVRELRPREAAGAVRHRRCRIVDVLHEHALPLGHRRHR